MALSAEKQEARKQYMRQYYETRKADWNKRTPAQHAMRNAKRKERYAKDAAVREGIRADVKAWQTNNPEKRKAQRLKQYGLSLAQFNQMMLAQGGKCLICGHSDLSNPSFFPFVDHCHSTGKVRGLLCLNCNHGLGKFKDDTNLLLAAASYLSAHG